MKVLALHAYYRVLGGEDVNHDLELPFLRHMGHSVAEFAVQNHQLESMPGPSAAIRAIWNPETHDSVRRMVEDFRPDVAYINNIFPALSPSVYTALRSKGIPLVQVIHNYRANCLSANLWRDGGYCDLCVGKRLKGPGVRHGCWGGSRTRSLVMNAHTLLARREAEIARAVTRYIAVSQFVKGLLVKEGVEPERIAVRGNLVWPDPQPGPPPSTRLHSRRVLFVGREVPEKGIHILLAALPALREVEVQVIGVRKPKQVSEGRVTYFGTQPHDRVLELMAKADCVVVPSIWPEPFGRTVVESLSVGTPVVCSDVGGMTEFKGFVTLVPPGDTAALAAAIGDVLDGGPNARLLRRVSARRAYLDHYDSSSWATTTTRVLSAAAYEGRS